MDFYAYVLLASASLYIAYSTEEAQTKILASVFSIVFWVVCAIQHTYDYKTALSFLWWAYLLPISINLFLLFSGATDYMRGGFDTKRDPWEES